MGGGLCGLRIGRKGIAGLGGGDVPCFGRFSAVTQPAELPGGAFWGVGGVHGPTAFHAGCTGCAWGKQQANTAQVGQFGAGFSGQMQAPHRCQGWRGGDVGHNKWYDARAQGFFHHPQHIFGAFGRHEGEAARIDKALQALGVQAFGYPCGRYPEHGSRHLCRQHQRQTAPRAAAKFMHARAAEAKAVKQRQLGSRFAAHAGMQRKGCVHGSILYVLILFSMVFLQKLA